MRGHFQDKGRLSKIGILIIYVFNYCSWSIAETYIDMTFFSPKVCGKSIKVL